MPIHVRRIDDAYEAEITPPHGGGRPWRSDHPMSREHLIAALLDRGCHQSAIGDAMFEADPDWETRNPPTLIVELVFWGGDPGGLAFDKKWQEDDLKAPPATIRYDQAGWELISDAPPTATLEGHVKRIFEKLATIDLDRADRSASAVELSVAVHCHGGHSPELWIPTPMLVSLATLQANIGFDVYCW